MHGSDISYKNFSPTFLFAIKYDRTASGYNHSHDYIELLYIYAGVGNYEINGICYPVETGKLLIINPGVNHANIVTDKNHPLVILALGFTDIHLKGMIENTISFPDQTPVLATSQELRNHITKLFFHMLAEKEQNFPGKYDMMRCYLNQILLYIIRSYTKAPERNNQLSFVSHRKNHIVKTIIDYMEENYQEKISLEGIASNMYLSPIYISKLFKEETGESPIHYLIQIRLQKSIQLMKEHPEYSIKKIAQEVGYDDAYYFSKIFKKHMSQSPKDYRKYLIK